MVLSWIGQLADKIHLQKPELKNGYLVMSYSWNLSYHWFSITDENLGWGGSVCPHNIFFQCWISNHATRRIARARFLKVSQNYLHSKFTFVWNVE